MLIPPGCKQFHVIGQLNEALLYRVKIFLQHQSGQIITLLGYVTSCIKLNAYLISLHFQVITFSGIYYIGCFKPILIVTH